MQRIKDLKQKKFMDLNDLEILQKELLISQNFRLDEEEKIKIMKNVIDCLYKDSELYKIEYIIKNPILCNIFDIFLDKMLKNIRTKIKEIDDNLKFPSKLSKPQTLLYAYHEYLSDLYNNLQKCKFIQSEKNKKEVQYFIEKIDIVRREIELLSTKLDANHIHA